MKTTEGQLVIRDERFCIIAARFNETIVDRLVQGAIDTLRRHGADDTQFEIIRVPGAMEIPLAAQTVARTRQFDGIIALGVVIRGATPHFDYVCGECASGMTRVSLEFDTPVGFGRADDRDYRAGPWSGRVPRPGHKGADAALTAMEMVSLKRQLG